MKIDEGKLTAYLLGEVGDTEACEEMENLLAQDEALASEARELREWMADVEAAFATEKQAPVSVPSWSGFQSRPLVFPPDFTRRAILPRVSGLAATGLLAAGLLFVSEKSPVPDPVPATVSSHRPSLQDVDNLAALQLSDLMGPALTWSQSQVLAASVFLPKGKELLYQPVLSKPEASRGGKTPFASKRPFTKAWSDPYSEVPLYYDGLGLTKLELLLGQGQLPDPHSVEVEALVNGFHYEQPDMRRERDDPFSLSLEQVESPWSAGNTLLRIGLQAHEPSPGNQPRSNLVFLVDVSGSMDEPNKLPLVRAGLKTLLDELRPMDRIGLVTYGPASEVLLPSTYVFDRDSILAAISELGTPAETQAQHGIQEAYAIARKSFLEKGNNQVVVCTDGDLSLGASESGALVRLVRQEAGQGITLSVFGFGAKPEGQPRMERLAAAGEGGIGYIHSPLEVAREFSGRLSGLLTPVAMKVKMELEFNPGKIDSYRLIGFEDAPARVSPQPARPVKREVFAGHSLTALYELIPAGLARDPGMDGSGLVPPWKEASDATDSPELVTVRVHYLPEGGTREELMEAYFSEEASAFEEATADTRFAVAVTGFGQILRNSPYKGDIDYDWILETAANSLGKDEGGTRTRFLELVRQAEAIRESESIRAIR